MSSENGLKFSTQGGHFRLFSLYFVIARVLCPCLILAAVIFTAVEEKDHNRLIKYIFNTTVHHWRTVQVWEVSQPVLLPWPKKLRQPHARGTGAWSVEHARAYVWLAWMSKFFLARVVQLKPAFGVIKRVGYRDLALIQIDMIIWPLHVWTWEIWAESVNTLLQNGAIVPFLGEVGTKMAPSHCWDLKLSNEG